MSPLAFEALDSVDEHARQHRRLVAGADVGDLFVRFAERPDDRDHYAALKRSLVVEYRDDRNRYTEAKSAFISSVVERTNSAP